jgi:hypothetical protein
MNSKGSFIKFEDISYAEPRAVWVRSDMVSAITDFGHGNVNACHLILESGDSYVLAGRPKAVIDKLGVDYE